jgi:hypothetical protein
LEKSISKLLEATKKQDDNESRVAASKKNKIDFFIVLCKDQLLER